MIRKKKHYTKPKKLYEAKRIEEENILMKSYALKNKREIWKTLSKVSYFRNRAKILARSPLHEQQEFFNKLKALGLNTNTVADVLDLNVEDLLRRRLSTIVAQKKLASTTKQARQMVAHKKIMLAGRVVNSPSHLVPVAQENLITVKSKKQKIPKLETVEQHDSGDQQ